MHAGRPLPDHSAAGPRAVAPRALGHRWHNAGASPPRWPERGQPGGLVDVRVASGSRFDVRRMAPQDLTRACEPVAHGCPVVAGTLPRDRRAAAS